MHYAVKGYLLPRDGSRAMLALCGADEVTSLYDGMPDTLRLY